MGFAFFVSLSLTHNNEPGEPVTGEIKNRILNPWL